MIAPGEDGLLTPPRDPAALAEAMEKVLLDRVLGARLAARARVSAAEKFSVEMTVRELQCLLIRHAGVVVPDTARHHDPSLPEVPRPPLWARLARRLRNLKCRPR
jgi:hypothetical protein